MVRVVYHFSYLWYKKRGSNLGPPDFPREKHTRNPKKHAVGPHAELLGNFTRCSTALSVCIGSSSYPIQRVGYFPKPSEYYSFLLIRALLHPFLLFVYIQTTQKLPGKKEREREKRLTGWEDFSLQTSNAPWLVERELTDTAELAKVQVSTSESIFYFRKKGPQSGSLASLWYRLLEIHSTFRIYIERREENNFLYFLNS